MDEPVYLTTADEYQGYVEGTRALRTYKQRLVDLLTRGFRSRQKLPGYSVAAGRMVDFGIDKRLRLPDGSYNLRETVNCPETGFNMRMRAAIHAVTAYEDASDGPVYLNEQKTPLFRYFRDHFEDVTGSEYLGDGVPLGEEDDQGLRNEDATKLTFSDGSFNVLMSFEVLEHIPDYLSALKEAHRVLRPGGRFYFTAPFNPYAQAHLIRARIENGEVVHILEPEIHGDPVRGEGILCFQHFGWDIVKDLNDSGFHTVEAMLFDQVEYGYYSQEPIVVFRAVA